MKYSVFVCLCLLHSVLAVEIEFGGSNRRESKKLFGGYRITPRFCKPTRKATTSLGGPNICMFNHECSQRNGQVVGACMDGFLFGACCQLPAGASGELIESDLHPVTSISNGVSSSTLPPPNEIMSSGVSQITQTLLNPGVLPTAQDNAMVQISEDQVKFSTTGVTHTTAPETMILHGISNSISPSDFKMTTKGSVMEDRKTTMRFDETTVPYSEMPTIHISVSNAPSHYTPSPGYQKPVFRPKPSKPSDTDKYVLVPTISHTARPNKTQEIDSIVNILQMLNETSTNNPYYGQTSKKPPSTSYVFSATPTRRPGYSPPTTTSKKPPSTSYVFSTTLKPRRTTTPISTTKRKTKPTKNTNRKTTTIRVTTPYDSSSTPKPAGHSTVANSPLAFLSTRPPSTSYVYSSIPTRNPASTVNTHIAGPGFAVTSTPGQFSTFPSPAPTLIVLSPVTEDDVITRRPLDEPEYGSSGSPLYTTPRPPSGSIYSSPRPPYARPSLNSNNKPINSVTINNHVTQNIYSTSERPLPTVLITPKPSISSSLNPLDYNNGAVEVEANPDQLVNFPPVRNPNLNMSNPVLSDEDITTPAFIEDEALNTKVESFVNKIIQGLQEPFDGLKDVVYNRNTTIADTTTKKPVKKQGTTTKKPASKPTSRPTSLRPVTSRPVTTRPTTRRSTTVRRPSSTVTKRPSTTTKRPKTTKRPQTTTESFIEEENVLPDSEQYRDQCGIRPLLKTGRIVGGKGATFGEFPWQVLVRESTWLGLFTKNKCGGVLISNKYVMTAAHCQPGFLASLVAVFGEFDISGDLESRRPVSRNVRRVIVHRKYDAATFENDLALLELESPVKFDAHIIPICLPRDGEDFTGRMATVTGWGRLKYGGGVPSVLQEVQVPIMENHVCQEMFRTAGHSKVILDSFLCAGYANGQKDSCEGDSGGPLVLQRPDGRYQLAGTVSHGIKCAAPYLPGVYMRTTFFKPWIVAITGIDTS
ncbi:serine protease filzig [Tribolium castaneum]|uniref:serine protease filzig n=1 Tax=Tribolium castaneum TaxID=7070 RepID=UPI0000D56AD5|nr:PREDICTED: serine proteinase stubble [Tribolium castaneum]|eukprot:XP_015837473.1 PREDICTED: serine proteinase stubble [Tribolium castaneum]